MNVDIAKLKTLLEVLSEQDVGEFEHESGGVRIKIVRGRAPHVTAMHAAPMHVGHGDAPHATAHAAAHVEPPSDSVDVTSPFVGTFYRSPSPDAPSFVEVGSVVRAGQTVCIIEAMKLMNEIESELAGTIVEVYAQNGKPVEFGQKLFRLKKA